MTPWQILQASKASRAAPGYPAHHGHGVAVHYSTTATAPDGSRSFCVSTDKLTMQELNSRLASYLQQVQCLEASNQKLECQILQELDRKSPRDLKELDGYLKTVSLLQDQISECLSVQGQLKLQLLTAELHAFNLNVRRENEQENRGRVEAELKKLRLQEEELMLHKLPELQKLLNGQTQQMMELQIQHQQNVQGLLEQVSGGVAVEMQLVQSADMKLQLNDRRQTSVMLFDHNQDECCFNNQMSTLTFDRPAVSEVVTVALKQLRATAASLEEEMMLLQAQNMQLESYGQQQMESSVLQLEFLQQRADGLCSDLDSALEAAAQQAANHQDLLDVKSRLEIEIQNYWRLLDERGCQWVSKPADMSICAPSNTTAFRRKDIQDKTVSFQGGNLNMGAVQTKGYYTGTVQQTPLFTPLSETVTTVESIRVQNNSPLTSINTSNLTGCQSVNKTENQRTEALSVKTESESKMINRWSSLVEDKVHTINPESFSLKQTSIEVGFKEGTSTNTEITETITGTDLKQETHFITQMTTTDPGTQTLAEVVKETETVEMDCSEGYVHASNQDPGQIVSLMLETQAEVVRDAGEVAITAFEVSGYEGVHSEVSCEVTLMDDKNREEVDIEVEGTLLVHGLDQSLSLCDESNSKQNNMKEDADVGSGLTTASSCSANSDDIPVRDSITAGAETLRKSMTINRWSSLLEDKVHPTDPDLLNKSIVGTQISQGAEERSVLSLKLETQAEVVKDAGEVAVTEFEVSGSEGVQGEVSCEVTLMDDKNREEVEVEVEVEGSSLVHGLDQSLSWCNESNSKQKDMKEDADVGSGLTTASSCGANSDDILVRESITASAETLRKSMTINRWSSLLEDKVHPTDPDLLNKSIVGAQISQGAEERSVVSLKLDTQAEVVKDAGEFAVTEFEVSGSEGVQGVVSCEVTLMDDKNREEVEVEGTSLVHGLDQSLSLCDKTNSKQNDMKEDTDVGSGLPTASSCSANSDDILVRESITASAETLRKSMTINRWSSLLEDKVHHTDPDLLNKSIVGAQISQGAEERSVVSLKLETQAEVVKDAGEVAVTEFEVSGSEGVQGEVSCEVTLMDDNNRKEVEVEGSLLVHGLDQSLSLCDESNSKQNDMKEDADVGSGFTTASSCSLNSDDILVRESITASAETLRKSMTINRWSSLLEDKVHPTDPDLLNKSIVGDQISQGAKERSVVSLKLETQAEVVKDAGEVAVTEFEESGSEGVQGVVPCEVTLMDDKNREEVEVEGTLLVHGLDQSLSLCYESNSKQNDMKEDADVGSGFTTASACSVNSDDILVRESITASAETLRKSMTINRWSSLLEDKVHPTDPDLLNKSIVGDQISQGAKERSVVSLKLETQAEVVKDAGEVAVTEFEESGSEGVQGVVPCEVTLMDDKNREEVEVEGTLLVHGLDQRLSLCDKSNSKQNDMKENADVGSGLTTASACSANSDDIPVRESITATAETLRKSMTINRWSSLLEDKVHPTDPDLLNKSIVGDQISQGAEERSVVSLKLETQAEVVKDAGEVAVTAFEVSGSEGVQGVVSCEVTLMDDKNRIGVEVEVEGTSLVHGLDQNLSFCDTSNSKKNDMKEDTDAGSGVLNASSCTSDRNNSLNTKSITASSETLRKSITINRWSSLLEPKVHAIDPDQLNELIVGAKISLDVEERSVVMSTKTEINTTTGITSLLPDTQLARSAGVQAEPESSSLKQTTIEVKETETAQLHCTEGYVHAKNQDPAQVVSLKFETQAEVIRDAGEAVVTAFEVSGSEGVQGEVSCEVTLMDDKNRKEVEIEGTLLVHGLDQSLSLCDATNSKQNDVKEDADVGSGLPTASFCSTNSNDILVRESITAQSTEILKDAELKVNEEEVVNGSHVSDEVKVASLTDSGVILSSCDAEEPLSTTVPVACPIEIEVCPIDPEINLSQNNLETCLSEVEAKVCLNLIGEEEDDEVCLNLTEASACVRPVEKYVLSTKDESRSVSFGRDQALLEVDRNREVTTLVKDGSGLRFESFDGSSVGSPETRHGSEDQKKTSNMGSEERGQRNNDCMVDNKAGDSFGSVPAPGRTSFSDAEGKMSGMDYSRGGMAASFDGTTASSAGKVGGDTEAATTSEVQGEIRRGSGEWMVQCGNHGRSRLPSKESEESPPVATLPATSQPRTGRFGKRGSGEWIVYGGSIGRKSSLDGDVSSPNTGSEDSPSVATQLATKTPRKGRFGSTGSGEWRVYGGSTGSLSSGSGSERVRVSTSSCKIITTTGNQIGSGSRVSSAGSVLRRSSSLGSAEKLSSSGSGGELSSSSGKHVISSSGRFSSGSGEYKPIYSSASGCRSSVGSGGQPGRGKTTTRHRTHSPAERRSVSGGSGGWLSSSSAGENPISSTGSGSKLSGSGSSERINSRGGGRGKGSPRLGRANFSGGRVITSSDRPVRSTGSGAGTSHERISVCKMAALSMSAAGRERSQERQRQAQRSAQQEASASPLIQRWLTSADEVPMAEPDGLDDIIHP